MTKFLGPGCHSDIPHDDYIADPVEGGSLNSSGIKQIMFDCPARYYWNSPLNPDRPPQEQKKAFTLGSLVHEMLLLGGTGFHDRFHIMDPSFKDYRSSGAREERDFAIASGLTPIWGKELDAAQLCVNKITENELVRSAFAELETEQTLVWECEETGVMCRARFDGFNHDALYGLDYKTSRDAMPSKFARHAWDYKYFIQEAFYREGYKAVFGKELGKFWFVVQEPVSPFLVSLVYFDNFALDKGRKMVRKAKYIYAECKASGIWPGYDTQPHLLSLPVYAENELEQREELGDFNIKQETTAKNELSGDYRN